MKKFKFKFSKLTTVFIYIGLALAVGAAVVNTYFLIADGVHADANPAYAILQYTLMYFVAALLFVILISLLISSYYSVDEKTLKTSFGIIKSKYDVSRIETIFLDRTNNKLSVHFDNHTFIVIVVKPDWYEDFTDALLKANPKIDFSIKSKENSPDDSEKKD